MISATPRRAWRRLTVGALLAALLLAGCGDTGMLRHSPAQQAEIDRAERLADSDRPLDAARIYETLADEAPETHRFALATRAAALYEAAGRLADARRMLPDTDSAPPGERWLEWAPVAARLALDAQRPREALDALARLDSDNVPARVRVEALALQARAHFAMDDPVAGVRALLDRETWLDSEEALRENHRLLWRQLQRGGDAVLVAAERSVDDPLVAGWLTLGAIGVQASRDPQGVNAALVRWRREHPNHPAGHRLVDEVIAAYRAAMDHPRQIALLLPLSGRQQGVGLAVRDGFLTAHFERTAGGDDESERIRIRVYDTAEDSVQAAYRQALDDGADFVVGPLLREEVDAIAPLAGHVPTLALNNLSAGIEAPPSFYQFALSPEDEARQAAKLAAERHGARAVVLASSDDWGRRLLSAFTDELESLGGRVLEYARYDNWEQDFSGPITQLLQLDQSQQRRRQLADRLGMNLEFQPRRRQDADFVFLAARTPQARLIRPQLRYFFAADLPVYATSAVFEPAGGSDTDLNGIIFPDAPWLLSDDRYTASLRNELEGLWPGRGRQLGRLYAMGLDGYRLTPLLFSTDDSAGFPGLDGMSGRLSLAADGRVQRELGWAQFRAGRPQLLALPAGDTLQLGETGTGALRP